MGIGFLDLFKRSLGKKEGGENLRGKGGAALKYFFGSLSEKEKTKEEKGVLH